MPRKRRSTPIFSVSFLDCICCGFGGVLLLFVLVAGKQRDAQNKQVAEIREAIGQFEFDVKSEQDEIERLEVEAEKDEGRRDDLDTKNKTSEQIMEDLQQRHARLMKTVVERIDTAKELLDTKEKLATAEKPDPVPIPNVARRQYLTGFKLEGEHILFLVRASGSMVGNTVQEAIEIQGKTDEDKKNSEKWQRVVDSVRWLISSLPVDSSFQVMMFAEETWPLIDSYSIDWVARDDAETIREVLYELGEVVPQGGANLERAFLEVRGMSAVPDSMVLLTDGLPTQSDSYPSGEFVSDADRVRFFQAAARVAAPDIPVNTILYALEGDPASPFLFWQLADKTKGALVSPAPSWPDIR